MSDPQRPIQRGRFWHYPDGTVLPVVSGGSGEPESEPEPTPEPEPEPQSFSQADVDRIVQERLARAKAKPPSDYDDLKAKAAKLAEIEAANKSDLEKAQEAQRAADERASAAEARSLELSRRSAIESAAAKAGAADPEDVYKLLDKDAVTIGDDGQVTGAKEAVEALLKAKPHLSAKSTSAGSADGGARENGSQKPKTLEDAVLAAMKPSG